MPLTPHDLGLHKLLKLFTPLVRPIVNRAGARRLRKAVNIADVRSCAGKRVHSMCFGYLDSGGDDEVSLRRNHDAYTQLEMHFQVVSRKYYHFVENKVSCPGPGRHPATSGFEDQVIWSGGLPALLHLSHCWQQDVPPRGRDGRGPGCSQARLSVLPVLPVHHQYRGVINHPPASTS